MEIQKYNYCWVIPNNIEGYKLSDDFPNEDSVFKWCMSISVNNGCIILRCEEAPEGTISVQYFINFFQFDSEWKSAVNQKYSGHFEFANRGCYDHAVAEYLSVLSEAKTILMIEISAYVKIKSVNLHSVKAHFFESAKHEYFEQLLKNMKKYSEFSDVKLQIGNIEINTHKTILAAISPVFRAMLTNNFIEKNSGCIKIDDMQEDIARLLIDFIYTGDVKFSKWELAGDLLKTLDKYDIQLLRKICINYLESQLNQENVFQILHIAITQNETNLKKSALNYLINNPKKYKARDFGSILHSGDGVASLLERLFEELVDK